MNIEFNIEELILHGFDYRDRIPISKAVEHELARLISEREIPALATANNNFTNLEGGSFDVAANSHPRVIGAQIAQAVYRGLNR
jgi:hypothetical protein